MHLSLTPENVKGVLTRYKCQQEVRHFHFLNHLCTETVVNK